MSVCVCVHRDCSRHMQVPPLVPIPQGVPEAGQERLKGIGMYLLSYMHARSTFHVYGKHFLCGCILRSMKILVPG